MDELGSALLDREEEMGTTARNGMKNSWQTWGRPRSKGKRTKVGRPQLQWKRRKKKTGELGVAVNRAVSFTTRF